MLSHLRHHLDTLPKRCWPTESRHEIGTTTQRSWGTGGLSIPIRGLLCDCKIFVWSSSAHHSARSPNEIPRERRGSELWTMSSSRDFVKTNIGWDGPETFSRFFSVFFEQMKQIENYHFISSQSKSISNWQHILLHYLVEHVNSLENVKPGLSPRRGPNL